MTKGNEPLQLFRIPKDVFDAVPLGEINQTYLDMYSLGIAHPPFENFAVEVKAETLLGISLYLASEGAKDVIEAKVKAALEIDMPHKYLFKITALKEQEFFSFVLLKVFDDGQVVNVGELVSRIKDKEHQQKQQDLTNKMAKCIHMTLIVLLATKNIEKNEIRNKQMMAGKFNGAQVYRKDYPITTTLTIGKITENHESVGTGSTVRPHLRRGHIRNQHYGPNNEMTKKIFIQPVFVNADEGWVANREAYNVRMAS